MITLCLSAGWAAVVVNVLTFGVLGWTLYWIWRYARAADRAASAAEKTTAAAIEQAEAVQKPCIVVPGVPPEGLHAAATAAYRGVYEGRPPQEASYEMVLEAEPRFLNIGSGSALNVRVVKERKQSGRWEQDGPPGDAGSLAAREDFRLALLGLSAFPDGDDVEYRLTITYESLSGTRYVSEQTIENRWLGPVSYRRVGA